MKISRYLDHAVLKPGMTPEEVKNAIQLGIDLDVYSVCVQPRDIDLALTMCKGTNTLVSCVLDFPHGAGGLMVKKAAAEVFVKQGVHEIDMVMNYGAAKGGAWDVVQKEIEAVVSVAHAANVLVKVIFETCELDEETIRKGVEVCIAAKADFVKTSTGFASAGATVETVGYMVDQAKGRIRVKPSGGIRSYNDARHFVEMGAHRLGVGFSTSAVLVKGEGESTEAY